MRAESTRGDIQLCQRRRAKRAAGDRDGCSTYLTWVVQDQGLENNPDRVAGKPASQALGRDSSVLAVLNMGWRAQPRGTRHHRVSANPNPVF